jgi:hypothetical protein
MIKGQTKDSTKFTFHVPVNLDPEIFEKLTEIKKYFGLSNRKIAIESIELFVKKWNEKKNIMEAE